MAWDIGRVDRVGSPIHRGRPGHLRQFLFKAAIAAKVWDVGQNKQQH